MSITIMEPPKTKRGRVQRLSDEDIKALADAVSSGKWAGDEEPVEKRTTAYQRGVAARTRVLEQFEVQCRVGVTPVDEAETAYVWVVGPVKVPKAAAKGKKAQAEAPAEAVVA